MVQDKMTKKKINRPVLYIDFTSSLKLQLVNIARNKGTTITGLVRHILVEYIEKTPPEKKVFTEDDEDQS